jgi:hypothetical protein
MRVRICKENRNSPDCSMLVHNELTGMSMRARADVAPGVGFKPTRPKGPQAFKSASPGLGSTSADLLHTWLPAYNKYALETPALLNQEISVYAFLRLF